MYPFSAFSGVRLQVWACFGVWWGAISDRSVLLPRGVLERSD